MTFMSEADFRRAEAEEIEATRQIERLAQAVLDAALAWDTARYGSRSEGLEALARLLDAIRAYRAAKEAT